MDEIPVAKRQANPEKKAARFPTNLSLIVGGGIIVTSLVWFVWQSNTTQSTPDETTTIIDNNIPEEIEEGSTNNIDTITPEVAEETTPENILGHLRYSEAPTDDLKSVTSDGRVRLRSGAADRFIQMQQDARRQGILLTALSGYRSISEQEYLFFEIKAQRNQDASTRAEVSAPPGFSEHHTGYAIDIGDGNAPATDLGTNFDQTPAYQWLQQNAARYNFELSFPPDNLQGISYEPWHWRYVGDSHSLETFYNVHQLKTDLQK